MPAFEPAIYPLKAALQGISPMIWRRLLIREDTAITDLHYILQTTPWDGLMTTFISFEFRYMGTFQKLQIVRVE